MLSRLLIALHLHRDTALRYSWRRAWNRSGELA